MITVEDFNSVIKEYKSVSIFHEIDTSLISTDYDYDDIQYDFCRVSRETTNADEYTFQFEVVNGAWTGAYYFLDANGDYIDSNASYSNGVITFVCNSPTVTLVLYLCNVAWSFYFERLTWRPKEIHTNKHLMPNKENGLFYLNNFGLLEIIELKPFTDNRVKTDYTNGKFTTFDVVTVDNKKYIDMINDSQIAVCRISSNTSGNPNRFYWDNYDYFTSKSVCPLFLQSDTAYLGKINSISFNGVGSEYYKLETGILKVNGEEFDVDLSYASPITVPLDLTNVKKKGTVKFSIHSNPVNSLYDWDYYFSLPVAFYPVDTVEKLSAECGTGGASIFKLDSDLTLTGDLTVSHDVNIIGDGCTIDLDGYSIIVSGGVRFELSDCSLVNGDNAIVQKADSEVVLTGVTFTNCVSSEYSNLGSCIYCDIDLDSLDVEDDFKTTLNDCSFFDNQSAILSGGTLVMDGCKLHNTDLNYIDKHNVALLYQSDGTATIRNGIFDIDYTDESLCTNQESIGFAQCLFRLGTTATINGNNYTDLRDIGVEITSNACHIFAKYYYPSLEECVFTSPVLDKEDSAFCYALTGLNKVFKHNVQITKASNNAENTYRKIEW